MLYLKDRGFQHAQASEITPREVYEQRRSLLKALALGAGGAALSTWAARDARAEGPARSTPLPGKRSTVAGALVLDKPTPLDDVTTYNNFYEFGTDKADPARRAGSLQTRPWTVAVEGAIRKPKVYDLDELLRLAPMEERVYRLRCVEGWSMVIPWVGYSLSELIRRLEPTGDAKFVEFTTLADPKQMPALNSRVLSWPYVEGLRMDEAMHPLTILVVGLYGEVLPNQDGAPLRLAVPWKYGFKHIKSIVRVSFTDKRPKSYWEDLQSSEYGFWANVNPEVPHPRWSQASEELIGTGERRPTLLFNGYGEYVAGLYKGLDDKERLWV